MKTLCEKRALPILENAFKQQELCEKLYQALKAETDDYNVNYREMLLAIFDVDFETLSPGKDDELFGKFLDLVRTNEPITTKAAKFYQTACSMFGIQNTTDESASVILSIIADQIKFDSVAKPLEQYCKSFVFGKGNVCFSDEYRGNGNAYELMGIGIGDEYDPLMSSLDDIYETITARPTNRNKNAYDLANEIYQEWQTEVTKYTPVTA